MKKNRLVWLLLLMVLISLMSCSSAVPDEADLTTEKNIRALSFEEFKFSLENRVDGFYYVGSEDCPFCVQFYPKLLFYTKKFQLDTNALDVTDLRAENNVEYSKFKDEWNIKYIPAVIVIIDGEIVAVLDESPDDTIAEYFPSLEGVITGGWLCTRVFYALLLQLR